MLVFVYVPLVVVVINSFNADATFSWPPQELHPRLVEGGRAEQRRAGRRAASRASRSALLATAIALVLGTLAAFALQRYRFFGKQRVSAC